MMVLVSSSRPAKLRPGRRTGPTQVLDIAPERSNVLVHPRGDRRDHVQNSFALQLDLPPPSYSEAMYQHERPRTAGRPSPNDQMYSNQYPSQPYLSPNPPPQWPYQQNQAWASDTTLAPRPPPQPYAGAHSEGGQSSVAPRIPPRPASRSRARNDCPIARGMNQGAALYDNISSRLEEWLGDDTRPDDVRQEDVDVDDEEELGRALSIVKMEEEDSGRTRQLEPERSQKQQTSTRSKQKTGLINYKKSWMYANSRLPPYQPPFKAYLETWRLIGLAARASANVYANPKKDESEHFFAADPKNGSKAMVLKSKVVDDRNIIVFSIRGSQYNYFDWATNLRQAPKAPEGFLDDEGNACHAGFLQVARAMIAPVADRLRQILEADPSRCTSSLLITGHSAGGAVASLLYMHMHAKRVESELNILTGCFKRVHCVTFGAPPVSLLPLQKSSHRRDDKSLFLSIANEGDLVVRADKAYIISLGKLLAAPVASNSSVNTLAKKVSMATLRPGKTQRAAVAPYWDVPPATLSNAGRMVLLREKPDTQKAPVVEAISTSDEQLRNIVFGDPAMHLMSLYKQRIERLAFAALMGDAEV